MISKKRKKEKKRRCLLLLYTFPFPTLPLQHYNANNTHATPRERRKTTHTTFLDPVRPSVRACVCVCEREREREREREVGQWRLVVISQSVHARNEPRHARGILTAARRGGGGGGGGEHASSSPARTADDAATPLSSRRSRVG